MTAATATRTGALLMCDPPSRRARAPAGTLRSETPTGHPQIRDVDPCVSPTRPLTNLPSPGNRPGRVRVTSDVTAFTGECHAYIQVRSGRSRSGFCRARSHWDRPGAGRPGHPGVRRPTRWYAGVPSGVREPARAMDGLACRSGRLPPDLAHPDALPDHRRAGPGAAPRHAGYRER